MPDEPVPGDAAGLRAANARLRELLAGRDAEIGLLRADLDAECELRRRLELRLAELERRLGMDSTDSGTERGGGPPVHPRLCRRLDDDAARIASTAVVPWAAAESR